MMSTAPTSRARPPASTSPRPTRARWSGSATSPTTTGPTSATSRSPPTAARTGCQGSEPAGVTGGGTVAAARRRQPVRLERRTAPACTTSSTLRQLAGRSPPASPAGARRRVRPGQPEEVLRLLRRHVLRQHRRRRHLHRARRPACPPTGNVRFKAVPGREGDIWLAGGTTDATYGLWHSTDSGATFTKVAAVTRATASASARPHRARPTRRSTRRKIDGVAGIFRSDDAGATWVRINDDRTSTADAARRSPATRASTAGSTSAPTAAA